MGEDEDPGLEKNYPSYVINKCMSHHLDTVMFANEMNMNTGLDSRLQYDFFYKYSQKPQEILTLG